MRKRHTNISTEFDRSSEICAESGDTANFLPRRQDIAMRLRILAIVFSLFSTLGLSEFIIVKSAVSHLVQTKQRRPGWKCPNGNSFEECEHECKWILIKNGKVDRSQEMSCGMEIAAHSPQLKKIYDLYDQIYNSCGKDEDLIRERTPCNFFAARVLKEVYGVKDFQIYSDMYMTADRMNQYLESDSSLESIGGVRYHWRKVSGEEAIIQANVGRPVVASTKGHVAVVIPGAFQFVDRWKDYAPQVVSMFLDDPQKGKSQFRCMPCTANQAFAGNAPSYYVRKD